MKRALRGSLAWSLALAGLLAACERVEVSTSTSDPKSHEERSSLQDGQEAPSLVQRIASARERHAFQGVRHVQFVFHEQGLERRVETREQVSADGHGGFAIETLDIAQPALSPSQQDVFRSLQSLRQGMSWRYRDFTIRHVGLFQQHYALTDEGEQGSIAGLPVQRLRVERQDQSGSVYTLHVHAPTGLVLRAREETREGGLIAEATYETISLQPDLSEVVWHQPVTTEHALPLSGSLAPQVGFEPRAPHVLPAGFQLIERTQLTDPIDGSLWVKSSFTDGVESIFFVDGGPIVGGNGIHSGVPEIQADLVQVAEAAPWRIARGNLRGQRVLVLGKLHEQDLLLLLRSAME